MVADDEIELKLLVAPDDCARLLELNWVRAAEPAALPLSATYLDTADGALARAGFTLRVRDEGGQAVQTVKAIGTAAGLFARPEWSCAVAPGAGPRFDAAAGPLADMLPADMLAAVVPRFTVAVQRTQARIADGAATVLLAIDRGAITAGERREPVSEVELELVTGSSAALFALARRIDAAVPARLAVLSKAGRGERLRAGRAGKPAKAERVPLGRGMDAATAFATIAASCLRQFRLNEDLLARGDDPATLHQARVGLRRLRSALSVFRPLFADDPLAAHHREELRWLQQVLGDARDLDVLAARMGAAAGGASLAMARAEAYEAAAAALASPRARVAMLDLSEWLATGPWRGSAAAARPARDVAVDTLDRLRRRLKRAGRGLARLSDKDRHQVRIEAKKLRYAAEFVAALFPGRKAGKRHAAFVAAVATLQERLGTLNDLATAPALSARFGLEPAAVSEADRDALLAAAVDARDELIEARRFWR